MPFYLKYFFKIFNKKNKYMKYLKFFENESDYQAFVGGRAVLL